MDYKFTVRIKDIPPSAPYPDVSEINRDHLEAKLKKMRHLKGMRNGKRK